MKEFKEHYIKITKNYEVGYSFDTFRTPKGCDKAICNGIRIIGIFGFLFVMTINFNMILKYILMIITLIMCGITEVKFLQDKNKRFQFKAW